MAGDEDRVAARVAARDSRARLGLRRRLATSGPGCRSGPSSTPLVGGDHAPVRGQAEAAGGDRVDPLAVRSDDRPGTARVRQRDQCHLGRMTGRARCSGPPGAARTSTAAAASLGAADSRPRPRRPPRVHLPGLAQHRTPRHRRRQARRPRRRRRPVRGRAAPAAPPGRTAGGPDDRTPRAPRPPAANSSRAATEHHDQRHGEAGQRPPFPPGYRPHQTEEQRREQPPAGQRGLHQRQPAGCAATPAGPRSNTSKSSSTTHCLDRVRRPRQRDARLARARRPAQLPRGGGAGQVHHREHRRVVRVRPARGRPWRGDPEATPHTQTGWRDPNFEPAPGSTAVPACWRPYENPAFASTVDASSSAAPIDTPAPRTRRARSRST